MKYFYTGECIIPLNKPFCFEKINNRIRFNHGEDDYSLYVSLALQPLLDEIINDCDLDVALVCVLNRSRDGEVTQIAQLLAETVRRKVEKPVS